MGQEGVTKAFEILHNELDKSMAFAGKTDVTTLDRGDVILPGDRAKMALGI